jgi:DNA-binding response OmpR family regulator
MQTHTILIATKDEAQRSFLGAQLDADGHTALEASTADSAVAKLTENVVDVLLLGNLQTPADSPALLRAIRADQHPGVHPAQPVVTLGAADELSTLRAYEAGSDHHLPTNTGYVVLRAVLASVVRRSLEEVSSRHLHVGELHIDISACSVEVAGHPVRVSRIEFDLLVKLASDPARVFSKAELKRAIGRDHRISDRTVDSHACRLRNRLGQPATGGPWIPNTWGRGYSLVRAENR